MNPTRLPNSDTRIFISASSKPGNFGATVYNSLFDYFQLNCFYFPIFADNAQALISAVRTLKLAGCSISMPLKSQVVPLLDELETLAKDLNSVNTIVNRSGLLMGYNTDEYGFCKAMGRRSIRRAVIFGAGGVVPAIIHGLRRLECTEIGMIGRNFSKIQPLGNKLSVVTFPTVEEAWDSFDLFVNATPCSQGVPNENMLSLLERANIVMDLLVSPRPTVLVSTAQKMGKDVISGIEMAIFQFLKQFEIYTGIIAEDSLIREIVKTRYQ